MLRLRAEKGGKRVNNYKEAARFNGPSTSSYIVYPSGGNKQAVLSHGAIQSACKSYQWKRCDGGSHLGVHLRAPSRHR